MNLDPESSSTKPTNISLQPRLKLRVRGRVSVRALKPISVRVKVRVRVRALKPSLRLTAQTMH